MPPNECLRRIHVRRSVRLGANCLLLRPFEMKNLFCYLAARQPDEPSRASRFPDGRMQQSLHAPPVVPGGRPGVTAFSRHLPRPLILPRRAAQGASLRQKVRSPVEQVPHLCPAGLVAQACRCAQSLLLPSQANLSRVPVIPGALPVIPGAYDSLFFSA